MGNYLDKTGLTYFWGKLKTYFQEKLVSGVNVKTINGNSLLGSGNLVISGGSGGGSVPYCVCESGSSVSNKVATIVNGELESLSVGAQILVKFSNSNYVNSPTLQVGTTEAKTIMLYGTTSAGSSPATSWFAGSVIMFTYDGTYWMMTDWLNTDTTYSWGSASDITSKSWSALITRPVHTVYAVQYFSWPIGAVMETTSNTNPTSHIGGDWLLIEKVPAKELDIITSSGNTIVTSSGDSLYAKYGVDLYKWTKTAHPTAPTM